VPSKPTVFRTPRIETAWPTSFRKATDLLPRGILSRCIRLMTGLALTTSREKEVREQLIYFGRLMHQQFFVAATDGNLSVRFDHAAIMATPTGISKGMMLPGDLVLVDLAGTKIKGQREVSSEIDMHLTIYRRRSDVGAIVHAHPCTATGFACAGMALNEPLCSEIVMSLGEVPLAPYGTTGTPELGASLAPFVSKHNAVLLANHGVVTYGKTLPEAYQRMEAVEHFAKIVLVTHQLGKKTLLSGVDIDKLLRAKTRYCAAAASNSEGRQRIMLTGA
jgi:L-fuculose-phosphate aldolase